MRNNKRLGQVLLALLFASVLAVGGFAQAPGPPSAGIDQWADVGPGPQVLYSSIHTGQTRVVHALQFVDNDPDFDPLVFKQAELRNDGGTAVPVDVVAVRLKSQALGTTLGTWTTWPATINLTYQIGDQQQDTLEIEVEVAASATDGHTFLFSLDLKYDEFPNEGFQTGALVDLNVDTIERDDVDPAFSNATPDGIIVDTDQPVVSVNIVDQPSAGVDPSTIEMTIDGTVYDETNPAATWVGGTFTVDLSATSQTLDDGTVAVTVTAKDFVLNEGTDSWSFQVDTTGPTFSNESPTPGAFINTSQPTVSVDITNGIAGVDPASIVMTIAGREYRESETGVTWGGTFEVNLAAAGQTLAEGPVNVEVNADDNVGNSSSTSWSFTVDTIDPDVCCISPADGSFIRGTVPITATVTDANPDTWTVSYDSTQIGLPGTGTDVDVDWDTTTGVADGSYTITVEATDKAGNTGQAQVGVTVNNTLPVVELTAPAPDAFLKGTVAITGSVADDHLSSWTLSANGVLLTSGTAAGPVNFDWDTTAGADGAYTLKLEAEDEAGNTAFTEVTVTVDNTAPEVCCISPADGASISGTVHILATITDDNPDTWTVSYNPDIDTGTGTSVDATWDTTAVADGSYTITVQATDKATNSGSAAMTVTVNNLPRDTWGIHRNGMWYLDTDGAAIISTDRTFRWGRVAGDIPIIGDFNGDGKDTWGIHRNGMWYLDTDGAAIISTDESFWWGRVGDIPLVGDFNGDGTDTWGIHRNGNWYLDEDGGVPNTTKSFRWGRAGDIPLVGNFNGNGGLSSPLSVKAVELGSGYQVLCFPNPASVGGEVTFQVLGAGINAIQVSIYDLGGGLVYQSELVSGQSITWDLRSEQTTLVANGIYLYAVTAKAYGELIPTEVGKLLILR